jgi:hypothetical protein
LHGTQDGEITVTIRSEVRFRADDGLELGAWLCLPKRDAQRCPAITMNAATATGRELYDAMLEIYPDCVNPGSLWGAANIAKKPASTHSRA